MRNYKHLKPEGCSTLKRKHNLELCDIESIWIEKSVPDSKPILVCSVNRPPSAPCSWVTELCCEINRASCDDREMIIMWDYKNDHLKDPPRYWSEALEKFELTQIITAPTRVTYKTSNLIDLTYTNKPQTIWENLVPVTAIADYYPVCITHNASIISDQKKHLEIKYRDFQHFIEAEFLFELTQINFDMLMSPRSSNEILEIIYDKLFSVVDKRAKPKSKRVRSLYKPKWISNEV